MKRVAIILLLSFAACMLLAQEADFTTSRPSNLANDRIRNVMAVDKEGAIYAATFGLEAYSDANPGHIPQGIKASLVRFNVSGGSVQNKVTVHLEETELQWKESLNAYTEDDYKLLKKYFKEAEADQRYLGGTGCWASPVIYQDGNSCSDVIYILNKSGMLFCMDMDFEEGLGKCRWATNLRDYERSDDDNIRFEYMATPTMIGSYLYVAGIKKVFMIDRQYGNVLCPPYTPGIQADDHLISPIVYDTNDFHREYYVLSKQGRLFCMSGTIAGYEIYLNGGYSTCYAPPLIDNSGHVFATGRNTPGTGGHPHFIYRKQGIAPNLNGRLNREDNYQIVDDGYSGTILSDASNGLYFLDDNRLDYYFKTYDTVGFTGSLHYDTLDFNDPISIEFSPGNRFRYVNNHPALIVSGNPTTCASMIVSINNQNVEPAYYPSSSTQANISNQQLRISFAVNNYNAQGGNLIASQSACDSHVSWGGIATFADRDMMNVIYGDEEGNALMVSGGLPQMGNFYPTAAVNLHQCLNSGLGFGKHQQGRHNVVTRTEVWRRHVYVERSNEDQMWFYLNDYGKNPIEWPLEINGTTYQTYGATFFDLYAHPIYTLQVIKLVGGQFVTLPPFTVDNRMGDIFIDANGNFSYIAYRGEDVPEQQPLSPEPEIALSQELRLDPNYPNPFNPSTTISYYLPEPGTVRLTICNLRGQVVKEVVNANQVAGQHSVVWNGTDNNNSPVSSGIYFTRIEHGNTVRQRRIMLLK
ncbi:MAG: FlgD immunoglobulin-like domain containing protein [Candidatus Cloacimonadota bacterium]